MGGDLEDPSRGADTQALGQTGQDAHNEVDCGLFTVEDRAVGLQKVALASSTVELTPRAAAGMAIGPQIVQPQPAAIVTMAVGTKMLRRSHRPGAAVRERHRIRPARRRWRSLPDLLCTQRTVRLVRQALERCGLGGALALGLEGRGWRGGRGRASPGPAER